mgnify:CR=1 FL=1
MTAVVGLLAGLGLVILLAVLLVEPLTKRRGMRL